MPEILGNTPDSKGTCCKVVSKESAPYGLHSCLTKEALGVVRSVDDNIDEMLKRLDEKYGDPEKIADVVIDSIKRVDR